MDATICEYYKRTGNCVAKRTCPYFHPMPVKLNINAAPFCYKPDPKKEVVYQQYQMEEQKEYDMNEAGCYYEGQ